MEFKEKSIDVFDILKEMVLIQRKTMKQLSLELDEIEKMIKQMEVNKQSYNICGIRNKAAYELESMPPNEFKRMVKELVDSIYSYCGGRYAKKSDILKECYNRMDKEYSARLDQKRIEFIQQKGYAPYDNLEMISDFYEDYLIYKSVLLSMLEKMAADIWVKPEQTICLPSNEPVAKKSMKRKTKKAFKIVVPADFPEVSTWDEAQNAISSISDNEKINQLYNEIFDRMDKAYSSRWYDYRFRFRKENRLTTTDKVDKKELVNFSKKLQDQFIEQLNIFIMESKKVS